MQLTPLAAALTSAGCSKSGTWAEGMAEIKWDRDTCARCSMVISDRRFASEIVGGPKASALKFDDLGCVIFYLRDKVGEMPWLAEPATRLWVADMANSAERQQWHDAHAAHYISKTSPMGYNYAAVARPQAMSLDFDSLRQHVLAKPR